MHPIRHSTPPLYLIAFAATTIISIVVTWRGEFSFRFQLYYVAIFACAFLLAIFTKQAEQLLGIVTGLFISLLIHAMLHGFFLEFHSVSSKATAEEFEFEKYIIPASFVAMGIGWILGVRKQKIFNDFHSDFDFIEKECFIPENPSYCVQFARRQLDPEMEIDNQKLHWQTIDLGAVSQTSDRSRELIHFETGKRVGQISVGLSDFNLLGISKFVKDPLSFYIAVRLTSGDFYELVEHQTQKYNIEIYFKGKLIGQFIDENPPQKGATWWQRNFRLDRSWKIMADDKTVGRFQFIYPVTEKTKCYANYGGEIELPISNPLLWYKKMTSRVVPPLEYEQKIPNRIKQLHFLLVIYFRTMIIRPSSGSEGCGG